jgi:crotonobetainyl-CoA:carnitine CoA-transferase CaiB-like acyl-CoA transferase
VIANQTKFCKFNILAEKVLEQPALATNPKFATNNARVANRAELIQIITDVLKQHDRDYWLTRFTGLGQVVRVVFADCLSDMTVESHLAPSTI